MSLSLSWEIAFLIFTGFLQSFPGTLPEYIKINESKNEYYTKLAYDNVSNKINKITLFLPYHSLRKGVFLIYQPWVSIDNENKPFVDQICLVIENLQK